MKRLKIHALFLLLVGAAWSAAIASDDLTASGNWTNAANWSLGHVPSTDDLLDYADYVFFGKKLPPEFGRMTYKEETKAFTWDVPK